MMSAAVSPLGGMSQGYPSSAEIIRVPKPELIKMGPESLSSPRGLMA